MCAPFRPPGEVRWVSLKRLGGCSEFSLSTFADSRKACTWRITIVGLFEGTLTVGISKMTLAGLFQGTLTVGISKMTLAELFQGTLMVVIHIMTLAELFEGTLTFGIRQGTLAGLFQGTLMVPKPTLNGAGFRGFYGLSEETSHVVWQPWMQLKA